MHTLNLKLFPFYDEIFSDFWEHNEVTDIDNGKKILINVPGREKEDIDISIKDHILTVKAKKITNFFKSSSEQIYKWDIKGFDENSINASLKNGILSIEIKYIEMPIKKITIN